MVNVVEVTNLIKHFDVKTGFFSTATNSVKAVDDISFEIKKGESLGLVGQSGCGKTTTARLMTLLEEKTSGEIKFLDNEKQELISIDSIEEDEIQNFRSQVQMIFQDPYESLNPRWTIKNIVSEPLNIHNLGSENDRLEAVAEMLTTVGLTPASNYMDRYPHELSGGQRQRVSIARALIMKPKFVICDEPTSMLDVSIRISIMDLMTNLAKDLGVSYLYITHDLAVARYMCERIAVMFNGKIVEIANTEELLSNPIHPYTKRLISSIPVPDPTYKRKKYELNFNEIDKIIKSSNGQEMVEVEKNHYVSTKDFSSELK
ncbi:MAG: ATP-binding cassette domain-containing protein [Actinomycetota bacterium]|nr:ATP-binding cassette domain-containing protein [Actinomycetota bacterium]